MTVPSERVLCVKREDMFPDGAWHGFVSKDLERHQAVIREQHFFKPRAEVETDPHLEAVGLFECYTHPELAEIWSDFARFEAMRAV